jgi:hypothetical protein
LANHRQNRPKKQAVSLSTGTIICLQNSLCVPWYSKKQSLEKDMGELRAALLGAIVGGIISGGATWMQANMAKDKDLATEKRQKLVFVMESAFKLNHCLMNRWNIYDTEIDDDCRKDNTEYRLLSISGLYFPEIMKEVAAYVERFDSNQLEISKCPAISSNPDEMNKRLDCIKAVFSKHNGGKELQNLQDKAELINKTLL